MSLLLLKMLLLLRLLLLLLLMLSNLSLLLLLLMLPFVVLYSINLGSVCVICVIPARAHACGNRDDYDVTTTCRTSSSSS